MWCPLCPTCRPVALKFRSAGGTLWRQGRFEVGRNRSWPWYSSEKKCQWQVEYSGIRGMDRQVDVREGTAALLSNPGRNLLCSTFWGDHVHSAPPGRTTTGPVWCFFVPFYFLLYLLQLLSNKMFNCCVQWEALSINIFWVKLPVLWMLWNVEAVFGIHFISWYISMFHATFFYQQKLNKTKYMVIWFQSFYGFIFGDH